VIQVINRIIGGEYLKAKEDLENENLLPSSFNLSEITVHIEKRIEECKEEERSKMQLLYLMEGILHLLIFAQANWTGPPLNEEDRKEEEKENIYEQLSLQGERVHKTITHLDCLFISRAILVTAQRYISKMMVGRFLF